MAAKDNKYMPEWVKLELTNETVNEAEWQRWRFLPYFIMLSFA